jgi:hypothetical protein
MKKMNDIAISARLSQTVPESRGSGIVQPAGQGEPAKRPRNLKRLLALGAIGMLTAGVGLAREKSRGIDPSTRTETSARQKSKGRRSSKVRERTIIFVGGKKAGRGASKRSNPTASKKVNGALNPQPIPPGKRRLRRS